VLSRGLAPRKLACTHKYLDLTILSALLAIEPRLLDLHFRSFSQPHHTSCVQFPDMATTTLNRIDAACHIHKLPAELLENVLLYAVSHVNSPGMDEHGRLRNISAPGPSTTLDFRSTCREFRDASYRALAKVIWETIYDLRWKISIQNLETLSKMAQLAPWVTKLTFSCLIVNESFPIQLKGPHDTLGPALTKLHPEIHQDYA
jgi:hypothetical protein